MIAQSKAMASSCFWFSTLISRSSHLKSVIAALKKAEAIKVKTISMSQGNKVSRLVAWTYLTPEQQKKWVNTKWN
jgi:23S rRNA (adenine1618-N6)-methyltransferase